MYLYNIFFNDYPHLCHQYFCVDFVELKVDFVELKVDFVELKLPDVPYPLLTSSTIPVSTC